ncbi:unnamed protein product [Allacma fusca]|uniref:REST corepressor n=1 Tax=Allacma fusca TaxID=39272 RepID=A0A8J2K5X3_9HEXA|nr:unnamed protein product [Allacma fusca]
MRRIQILGKSPRSSNGLGHGNSNTHTIWVPPNRQQQHHHHDTGGGNERERDRDHSIQILNAYSSSPNPNASSNKPYMDFFEDREGAGGMRVGRDYQAKVPALVPKEDRNVQGDPDRALLVWCPTERLNDDQIEQYLSVARDKYQYSGEQALGLLFWHRYDISRALHDLGNFTPNPEEWTIEDKVLFEQAFQFHGKAFDRIRSMLPDKSMSSLIRYYYKWKKLRCKTSVMDRQVKKFSQEDVGDDQNAPPLPNNSTTAVPQQQQQTNSHSNYLNMPLQPNAASLHHHDNASDSDSDDIIKASAESGLCGNCGVSVTELHTKDNKESMCKTCFLYWKKTGEMRPLTGPIRRGDRQMMMGLGCVRQRRTPPKGMFINHDDLTMLASAPPQAENVTLQSLEKEVHEIKCRVQLKKQGIEMLKASIPPNGINSYRPTETSSGSGRVTARWSQEELLMAAQGVRRYGKNFQKIAEVMGTKSESHLKSFYANYRRRYGLDSLVQEHLLEQMNLDEMMQDNNNGTTPSTPSTPGGVSSVSSTDGNKNGSPIKPRCLEF